MSAARPSRPPDAVIDAIAEAVTVHDARGKIVYANQAAADLFVGTVERVLAAEPGELAARFVMRRADGSPVDLDDLPGRRVLRGLPAEPMLTRSVRLEDGRAFWMLTKAAVASDDDGGPLAVNI